MQKDKYRKPVYAIEEDSEHSESDEDEESEKLYCICRSSDSSGFMIGCDKCEEWFHGKCIKLTPDIANSIEKFFCTWCQKKNPSLKILYKSDNSIRQKEKKKEIAFTKVLKVENTEKYQEKSYKPKLEDKDMQKTDTNTSKMEKICPKIKKIKLEPIEKNSEQKEKPINYHKPEVLNNCRQCIGCLRKVNCNNCQNCKSQSDRICLRRICQNEQTSNREKLVTKVQDKKMLTKLPLDFLPIKAASSKKVNATYKSQLPKQTNITSSSSSMSGDFQVQSKKRQVSSRSNSDHESIVPKKKYKLTDEQIIGKQKYNSKSISSKPKNNIYEQKFEKNKNSNKGELNQHMKSEASNSVNEQHMLKKELITKKRDKKKHVAYLEELNSVNSEDESKILPRQTYSSSSSTSSSELCPQSIKRQLSTNSFSDSESITSIPGEKGYREPPFKKSKILELKSKKDYTVIKSREGSIKKINKKLVPLSYLDDEKEMNSIKEKRMNLQKSEYREVSPNLQRNAEEKKQSMKNQSKEIYQERHSKNLQTSAKEEIKHSGQITKAERYLQTLIKSEELKSKHAREINKPEKESGSKMLNEESQSIRSDKVEYLMKAEEFPRKDRQRFELEKERNTMKPEKKQDLSQHTNNQTSMKPVADRQTFKLERSHNPTDQIKVRHTLDPEPEITKSRNELTLNELKLKKEDNLSKKDKINKTQYHNQSAGSSESDEEEEDFEDSDQSSSSELSSDSESSSLRISENSIKRQKPIVKSQVKLGRPLKNKKKIFPTNSKNISKPIIKRKAEPIQNYKSFDCYNVDCHNSSRVGSKYCSDECGISMAEQRLLKFLPERINNWRSSISICEEKDKCKQREINEEIKTIHYNLDILDTSHQDLTEFVERWRSSCNAVPSTECGMSDETIQCVTCGAMLNSFKALAHMENCFQKIEGNTMVFADFEEQPIGTKLFCDHYDSNIHGYCKRLAALCDHTKDPKIDSKAICAFPLSVNEKSDKVCMIAKIKCHSHINWERIQRAVIDINRYRLLLRYEELGLEERKLKMNVSQRGGVMALLTHDTIDHQPFKPMLTVMNYSDKDNKLKKFTKAVCI